jgi:hypothetical protein
MRDQLRRLCNSVLEWVPLNSIRLRSMNIMQSY